MCAILAGVDLGGDIERSMEELAALAEAAGAEVAGVMVQSRERADRGTYVGTGKAEELKELCHNMEANIVICNDELSGVQLRNLEEITGQRVIDRTILILDIFASRAISKEGKLQVELAQLQYRLPRLTGFGKSLSRLGGGIGTRGPGEKKLETDRRHISRRMDDIKREIKEAGAHRAVQRARRKKNEIPVAAIVGYTNSGKSAIMNKILAMLESEDKSVAEKDMLFATLDTFQRRIVLEDNMEFILVDTVGFVSKLPHSLIKAFRATLEEVVEADLLLHVVDSSYEDCAFRINVVEDVLAELGAAGKDTIMAYNKIDLLDGEGLAPGGKPGVVGISAKTGENMEALLEQIKGKLFGGLRDVELLIPYSRGDVVSWLSDRTPVVSREYAEDGVLIKTRLNEADFGRLSGFVAR
jgi:GTP-binding protein HflX